MKPFVFLLFLVLYSAAAAAQSAATVTESEDPEGYTYRITLRKDPGQRLVSCTNERIEGTVQLRKRARMMLGIDACSQLTLDNRHHTITIEHLIADAAERARVKTFAAHLTTCLSTPEVAVDAP